MLDASCQVRVFVNSCMTGRALLHAKTAQYYLRFSFEFAWVIGGLIMPMPPNVKDFLLVIRFTRLSNVAKDERIFIFLWGQIHRPKLKA